MSAKINFISILSNNNEVRIDEAPIGTPAFFTDLNLDQIIGAVTAGHEANQLLPIFSTPLRTSDAIRYRQEVFRDLEDETLVESIGTFVGRMSEHRRCMGLWERASQRQHAAGWFLEAVKIYCHAVSTLRDDLQRRQIASRGLTAFRLYLGEYEASHTFTKLREDTERTAAALARAKYCLLIRDNSITVRRYEGEEDYAAEVEAVFARFKQGAAKDYRVAIPDRLEMNHVEEKILSLIARLYPDEFTLLDDYCLRNRNYLDRTLDDFTREVQFYLAYLRYLLPLKRAGRQFCYPRVDPQNKEVFNYEGFDLALAHKLLAENTPLVCNDFQLRDPERIIVVTGPNQGGKTTFARTFGQLHYLAALGCPVPGREAQLLLCDRIFTHFEKQENINDLRGKLQDDLIRIRQILAEATAASIIILNEIFTSTTLQDALFLGRQILGKISRKDLLCICVTFLDELSAFDEKTVSMASTVDPENPTRRTYRVIRKAADGLSYALSLAEKHGLTYDGLKERLRP